MGNLKNVYIAPACIYDDPEHPETSDYNIILTLTSVDGVLMDGSGKKLTQKLTEMDSDIKSAARAATIVVAAADASDNFKKGADYVCDGYMDEVEINEAIEILGNKGGKILLSEGHFWIGNGTEIPTYNNGYGGIYMKHRNATIEGMGVATAIVMIPKYANYEYRGIISREFNNTVKSLRVVNGCVNGEPALNYRRSFCLNEAHNNIVDNVYFTDRLGDYRGESSPVYNPYDGNAYYIWGNGGNDTRYYGIYISDGNTTYGARIANCYFNATEKQILDISYYAYNLNFLDNVLKYCYEARFGCRGSTIRLSCSNPSSFTLGSHDNRKAIVKIYGSDNTVLFGGNIDELDITDSGRNNRIIY